MQRQISILGVEIKRERERETNKRFAKFSTIVTFYWQERLYIRFEQWLTIIEQFQRPAQDIERFLRTVISSKLNHILIQRYYVWHHLYPFSARVKALSIFTYRNVIISHSSFPIDNVSLESVNRRISSLKHFVEKL